MPAAVLNVRVAARRACPVCTESVCAKPAECLYFLTSRPWADCDRCAGSGWASEDMSPTSIYCEACWGSGLAEHDTESITPEEISERAAAHLSALVDRLRDRLASTPLRAFSWTWADSGSSRPQTCPGCAGHFPAWTRVPVGGLEVLTHDGDAICPADPTFGALTGPELAPAASPAVAA